MSCSDYHIAICDCMKLLAEEKDVIFLGQQVASEEFYGTLKDIPMVKRMEMPVAEELQTGVAIGLALEGYLPVSIYQRMDFLPRAADQLINHLSLINKMSRGRFNPKVIIRVTIGSTEPFDVGPQHNKDLVEVFKLALSFPVIRVRTAEEVWDTYSKAIKTDGSIMIIEEQDLYGRS